MHSSQVEAYDEIKCHLESNPALLIFSHLQIQKNTSLRVRAGLPCALQKLPDCLSVNSNYFSSHAVVGEGDEEEQSLFITRKIITSFRWGPSRSSAPPPVRKSKHVYHPLACFPGLVPPPAKKRKLINLLTGADQLAERC